MIMIDDIAHDLIAIAVALARAGHTGAAVHVAQAAAALLGIPYPSDDDLIAFGRDLGIVPPCPR